MRHSHTAVIERNVWWSGAFSTEPYEAAWASEAIFFVRAREGRGSPVGVRARAQISPDGVVWCDEGTGLLLPAPPGLAFCRLRHFGGWLRLSGDLGPDSTVNVIVYLVLKE